MKLSFILILVGSLQLSASVLLGQQVSVQAKASLVDVLEDLNKQTGTYFMYNVNEIDDEIEVQLDMHDASLEEVLNEICKQAPVKYEIVEDFVIITKKDPVPVMKEQEEKKEIKGTVTDSEGVPLPGVSVVVKGTNTGVATDIDGNYTLELENESAVLVFSFVGMTSQKIAYTGQLVQNVTLSVDSEQMQEVKVIATGYQRIRKEQMTGNAVGVTTEDLEQRITTDVTTKLEGQVAGLLLENDSEGEPSIVIGGKTSFTNNTPLIVVDGFPIEGGINSVNPNDIAGLSVLKDASAAAVWGAKASNGVIVITTKSGEKGKLKLSYSGDFILTTKPNFDLLNQASASELVDWKLEALEAGFYEFDGILNTGRGYNYLDPISLAYANLNGVAAPYPWLPSIPGGVITQEEFDAQIARMKSVDHLKELEDHLYRTTFTQRHNLSVSGASKNNSFFVSALFEDAPSKNIGNDSQTLSFNLKDNLQVTPKLSLQVGANINFKKRNNNNTYGDGLLVGTAGNMKSYTSLFNENGDYNDLFAAINQNQYDTYNQLGFVNPRMNPLEEIRNADNTSENLGLRLNARVKYDITSWMNIEGRYSYERNRTYNREHKNENAFDIRFKRFLYTKVTPDNSIEEQYFPGGELYESETIMTSEVRGAQLNINKELFGNHKLSAVIGTEFIERNFYSLANNYYGYDDRALTYVNNTTAFNDFVLNGFETYYGAPLKPQSVETVALDEIQQKEYSFYGNLLYDINEKYTLTASGRLDRASLLGASRKNQTTPLWSVGAGWNMHKEEFFNIAWINKLKPRMSYGFTALADQNTTTYLVVGTSPFDIDYGFGSRSFNSVISRPNPNLDWETTKTWNAGLDFALFNYRLTGSFNAYYKKSEDLLTRYAANPTVGYGNERPVINNGTLKNKGVELNLRGIIVDKKDFSWATDLTFSYNKNEVVDATILNPQANFYLPGSAYINRVVGKPIDALWSFRYAGLDNQGSPQIYADASDLNSEIIKYPEANPFGLDQTALTYSGQLSPKYFGGLSNTFSYKSFTLSVLMSYKFGHVFRKPTHTFDNAIRGVDVKDIANRWKQEGDELTTDVPGVAGVMGTSTNSLIIPRIYSLYAYSDKTVEDASHIRLNNISLSYELPKQFMNQLGVNSATLTAQINNLGLLWSANKDYDPDYTSNQFNDGVSISGGYAGPSRLAPAKQFILGVKVNF